MELFDSLSRPIVYFQGCSQVFPLPGSPSSTSAQAPPLILLLPPLTGAHAVNVMSTVPLLLHRARGGYLKSHHSPLVSASLQFAQISLLLLVGLL